MGTIEQRGVNSWRVGERLSTEQGRDWIRRPLTFPPTMSEAEQRRAAEVELGHIEAEIKNKLLDIRNQGGTAGNVAESADNIVDAE